MAAGEEEGGGRAQLPRWDGGGGGGGGAFCSSAAARGPREGMTFAKYQIRHFYLSVSLNGAPLP